MQELFSALFDLSFRKFVTPQIVKFVYVLCIVTSGVASLSSLALGGIYYVLAPLAFLGSVVVSRCFLEVALAIFQIARYSAEVARRGRGEANDEPSASF